MDRQDPPGSASSWFVVLEAGLCLLILIAPLPFGSVAARGRLTLEILALALTFVWALAALRETVRLPPPAVSFAMLGLLAVAVAQIVPLSASFVTLLSPAASALRSGLDPAPPPTLSLAAGATASALRTGAALAGVLVVTTSVVAARGAARIALAALFAASFQGLYGLLVVASGHDRIWNVPKTAYLDSATGTFINRNHFAAFLAATLPLGIGLVVSRARHAAARGKTKGGLAAVFGTEGSRTLLLALAALLGAAGLLLSFSRAGIALGVAATAGTLGFALRRRPLHRAAAAAALLAIAAVPLLDLGADRLLARFAETGGDYRAAGGRLSVAVDTLGIIRAFPVTGCGFGAFTWVYPTFSSPDVRLHYTHAHNDLLQLGAEGGLGSLAFLAVVLSAVARAGWNALGQAKEPLAIGAAFGLAALLLHALVDFNFHIPANAAVAAVLAGVLFGASWNGRS